MSHKLKGRGFDFKAGAGVIYTWASDTCGESGLGLRVFDVKVDNKTKVTAMTPGTLTYLYLKY